MFNYEAEQIFVVQPRNTGGGLLSFLFSLDSCTASVNFRSQSLEQKLQTWDDHVNKRHADAHVHGFINFGHPLYLENLASADHSDRYIHKNHFYELLSDAADIKDSMLARMPHKRAIGIYLTESCVKILQKLRPQTPHVDYYQLWVYANQRKILQDFFNIECMHTFAFSDMLDLDRISDHVKYCRDLFQLDIDINICRQIMQQWYGIIRFSK